MAASLKSLMSRLSLQPKNILTTTPVKSFFVSSSQFSVLSNVRSLVYKELLPLVKPDPQRQSAVVCKAFHTTPVSNVTLELKQWREHRVIHRFYRLHWGAWIRTIGGRYKGLYKKNDHQRWKMKQHYFLNKTQCKKLDVLVTAKWREPKHYVDTPYEPYHVRTNCPTFPNHRKFYP